MEIYKLYSIDIFFQGTFLLICLFLGVYIVFKDNLETFKSVNSLHKFSKELYELFKKTINIVTLKGDLTKINSFKYFGLIPVIIISSFIVGIIGNGIADTWIDSTSKNHLELKSLWRTKSLSHVDSTNNYKKQIRIKAFDKVFDTKSIKYVPKKLRDKYSEQLYFQSKHEILKDNNYYNYVRKSQVLVEYNRMFALGFFFLIICSLLNFILMIVRVIFSDYKDRNTWNNDRSGFISLGVIILFTIFSFLILNYFVSPSFDPFTKENFITLTCTIIIVYFGCFTFLLNIFEKFRKLRFSFFLYSIIYVISMVGYLTSAKIWVESESKVAKKVYGLFKTSHLTKQIKEIDFAIEDLKLNIDNIDKKE